MASVLHLFRATKKRLPMEELSEAAVVTDSGLEGCAHARHGSKRQVLLMDGETLEAMELQPGIIRENITTWKFQYPSASFPNATNNITQLS